MADSNQVSTQVSFKIFFEDQHLLVLSKPAGLLSQGDHSGDENLVDLLRVYFGRNYVGLVHRLDRNTTGLMVVAKRSKSADRLSEQLKDGRLIRHYHAILWGKLEGIHSWKHRLLKNEKTNEVSVIPLHDKSRGKEAVLKVFSIKNFAHPQTQDALTLARFELETGRSHQIRVQSSAAQHPLIGDSKYGNVKCKSLFSRPALHSSFLSFAHPMTQENLSFQERYPVDIIESFSAVLE